MLIALHKPYDVLSQFTAAEAHHRTLAELGLPPRVYPIGRLDRDSEGLILLSDEARWTARLLDPKHGHPRTYHAQVDGEVTEEALARLRVGVDLSDHHTLPAKAVGVAPDHPPRDPPIRYRKSSPTSWIELTLTEGKNRQVRRMTAAVGFPTLRLIRVSIGGLQLGELGLAAGAWTTLTPDQERLVLRR